MLKYLAPIILALADEVARWNRQPAHLRPSNISRQCQHLRIMFWRDENADLYRATILDQWQDVATDEPDADTCDSDHAAAPECQDTSPHRLALQLLAAYRDK